MPLTRMKSGTCRWLAGVLLVFLGTLGPSRPARADLATAQREYLAQDYPRAFEDFLALAELGQPVAQLSVAVMYQAGRGVAEASDIHAYAWATLAAENGETKGKEMADAIRPQLAPGSERIAGWVTAAYTPTALEKSLLPDLEHRGPFPPCKLVKWYQPRFPLEARERGFDGIVLVDFTIMPDGRV